MERREADFLKPAVSSAIVSLVMLTALFVGMTATVDPEDVNPARFGFKSVISAGPYVPHSPIVINDDSGFMSLGFPGDGSSGNPFLINGFEIDAFGVRNALYVANTTVYFVVSNSYLANATESGIALVNVTNGSLLDNICQSNTWNGIALVNSAGNNVSRNVCFGGHYGIHLYSCGSNDLYDNNCSSNGDGLYLQTSANCTLSGNIASLCNGDGILDYGSGVRLLESADNDVSNNSFGGNSGNGILLEYSDGNSISCNLANSPLLDFSMNNSLMGNTLTAGVLSLSYSNGNIVVDSNGSVSLDNSDLNMIRQNRNGSVSLSHSENNSIVDCRCNGYGIILYRSTNNSILNNNCSLCRGPGLRLEESDRNLISNNSCTENVGKRLGMTTGNPGIGIMVIDSSRNVIENNNCSSNRDGDFFYSAGIFVESPYYTSSENVIANNTADCNDDYGIYIEGDFNVLSNNSIRSNGYSGLNVWYGDGNSIVHNFFESNGGMGVSSNAFTIGNTYGWNTMVDDGFSPDSALELVNITNTVNGRPVAHIKDQNGGSVPAGSGQVILFRCTGVNIQGQNLSKADIGALIIESSSCSLTDSDCSDEDIGIQLQTSSSNLIQNNSVMNNSFGIALSSSDSNEIRDNGIFNNQGYGISLGSSARNLVWNNSLAWNNGAGAEYNSSHVQALDSGTNFWNTSTTGNYWGDWTSPDIDYNGIVDVPYSIEGGGRDFYPLATPTRFVPPQVTEFENVMPIIVAFVLILVGLMFKSNRNREQGGGASSR